MLLLHAGAVDTMWAEYVSGAVIAVILLVYLVYSLIKPEKF